MQIEHPLHMEAMTAAEGIREYEARLIRLLEWIEAQKLFREWGYSSLHHYLIQALNQTDDKASTLVRIMRKCGEVPELKEAIAAGVVTPSKVRPILTVTENTNASEWISKAATLLEKRDPVRKAERAEARKKKQSELAESAKARESKLSGPAKPESSPREHSDSSRENLHVPGRREKESQNKNFNQPWQRYL